MNNELQNNSSSEGKVINLSIKLLLIFILVSWCAMIVFPFVTLVLWAVILAVTIYPLYYKLLNLLKGKNAIASSVVTIILLGILLVPTIFMISAIVSEAGELKTAIVNKTLVVPPPNPKVAEWPLVGKEIYKVWASLSTNLESALVTYHDQILEVGQRIVGAMRSVFSNIMMFAFSIIIAGVFLAYSDESEKSTLAFARKLVGNKGNEFKDLVVQTIRNVSKGILGVAFIQFVIMGLCFMLAGVPLAGLWAILVFLIALIQLPGAIVAIPVIIYIYSVKEPVPATIWSVIILICGLSDNVLKPLLMGKGAPVPMIVIFLGAIGGFMLSGFIGLFTGAVVLSLGYKLAGIWVNYDNSSPVIKSE
ncbi:AI-2E family transporter [Solitalea longa]|uniref:AI-2E family transporter n=1 Tax=Solitalea longa TaxID=2079460 RepID=A0A2S5A384_9SPHI|nr:AI-2E family transporter [Solitalea longa]POY36762.1 AI-2E family transporter [Solitalea longa]